MSSYRKYKFFENTLKEIWKNSIPFPRIKWYDMQTGSEVEFAKSTLNLNTFKKITASRALSRTDEPSWISTKVVVQRSNFLNSARSEFVFAEDPRLFIFRSEPHAMIQTFKEEKMDVEISILNLHDGRRFSLSSPFGFNGKNWVPFEFNGALYFLYALSPLVIFVLEEYGNGNSLKTLNKPVGFKPKWDHDLLHSIGIYRGGSPAIGLESDKIFGFSHGINPDLDIHAHRLGVYSLKMPECTLKHEYLTQYKENFLIDAYGLQKRNGQVLLDGSMSLGDIHEIDSTICNFRMHFDFSQVKILLS